MPRFKQLLATDELIPVFSIARMPHPIIIDIFGLAGGYRGFWMDQEHSATTYEQIINASMAARAMASLKAMIFRSVARNSSSVGS